MEVKHSRPQRPRSFWSAPTIAPLAPSNDIPVLNGLVNTIDWELNQSHSRPQRLRSFWSAPRIATSGLVQRHSVFEWLSKHNRLRPEPIRFVKLDSEHAQSDGKSENRGLAVLDLARGRDSWCWPKGARPLGTRMNQSDLSYLTLGMRRVTGSPWIADFRCWTWPEVAILGADQKERGLWGREWRSNMWISGIWMATS